MAKMEVTKPMMHLVSFSGGKDSTAMLLRMMELGMKIDKVIYCDTWMDFPDMYEHIAKIKMMVKDIGIDFVELKNPKSFKYFLLEHPVKRRKPIKGNPKGYSWADSRSRWCTSKMKLDLINKYISNLSKNYNVVQYVGIAADEQRRLKREHNTNIRYPLVDWNWSEEDALNYCYQKGYDWNGLYKIFKRVSCWCCPLQSLADLRKLKKYFPELWDELKEMDKQTWRKFRADFSVAELEKRFNLENQMLSKGLSINGHNKEFQRELKKILNLKEV